MRKAIFLIVVVAVGVAAVAWYVRPRRPADPPAYDRRLPPDPRLAYDGPFRNVHPEVRYVGDAACAECHRPHVQSYAGHAMGRALVPVAQLDALPTDAARNNPFEAFGARFLVERAGGALRQRRTSLGRGADGRPVAEASFDVAYAIGSGTRGHSFLAVRDGFVLQTPISWYTQARKWDISPGFSTASLAGRPVEAMCLFCHANRSEGVDGTLNKFKEPVFDGHALGCERCHGPGEKHVRARKQDETLPEIDPTIVNPKHLDPRRRDAVCEQCHLAGETAVVRRGRAPHDFRPGLALDAVLALFTAADDAPHGGDRAVNHVEQMHLSRCFQGSDGRLGCTRCHDPHAPIAPERRVEHFRKACLECHGRRGCSVPEAERKRRQVHDSCIACHMPRYAASDIPHTASTDHRVVRRPRPKEDKPEARTSRGLPIVSFHRRRFDPDDLEATRDLGIALMRLADEGKAQPRTVAGAALPLLEAAVERDAEDWEAIEAQAAALKALGREATALTTLRDVLTKAPRRETALIEVGRLAESLHQTDEAVDVWRRLVEVNPSLARYRRLLARALSQRQAWAEARDAADGWLSLDPASAEAHALRAVCLLRLGDRRGAEAAFAVVEALRPENLEEYRTWYRNEGRR